MTEPLNLDEVERLRAMLHQVSWHAEDAANLTTEAELRAALRGLARTAKRLAEESNHAD